MQTLTVIGNDDKLIVFENAVDWPVHQIERIRDVPNVYQHSKQILLHNPAAVLDVF